MNSQSLFEQRIENKSLCSFTLPVPLNANMKTVQPGPGFFLKKMLASLRIFVVQITWSDLVASLHFKTVTCVEAHGLIWESRITQYKVNKYICVGHMPLRRCVFPC